MKHFESLEPRQLLTATIDQAHPATLRDSDGSTITIRLTGAGTAFADGVSGGFALSLSKSNVSTTLNIDVAGGNKYAIARAMKITGDIGSIVASAVELGGAIGAKSIGALNVRGLTNASLSTGWLGSLDAKRISNSYISGDRIGSLAVKGDVTNSRIHVSPAHDDQTAITAASVRGSLTDSIIFTLGDIGTVTAGAMIRSNVTAGVIFSTESAPGHLVQFLPNERSDDKLFDFSGKYAIRRVDVGSAVRGGGDRAEFSESIIAAYEIDDVRLTNVDGDFKSRSEFGVAGFNVHHVRRTFNAANAAKNSEAKPFANFTVRQISAPITFDPDSGSYGVGDNDELVHYSQGTMTAIGSVPGGGGNSTWADANGLHIGTVENNRAHSLYLAADGRYELRNRDNRAIARRSDLAVLIDDLFTGANSTSITISRPSMFGAMTLRATSTGPSLTLNQDYLGDRVMFTTPAPNPITGFPGLDWRPIVLFPTQVPTGPSYTVPTFDKISIGLKQRGNRLAVYREDFLLVNESKKSLGKLINVDGVGPIELSQSSMTFSTANQSNANFLKLVLASSADRLGSRRLPARWIQYGDTVTIFGLPNGGTAVLSTLGKVAINSTGAVATIPTAKALKQSLIDAGIGL